MGSSDPSEEATLTSVLDGLQAAGYTADFLVGDGGTIRCRSCGVETPAEDAAVEQIRRLEGASDPADMLAVVAVTCPHCGSGGVITLNYGPEMTEGQVALLHHAQDERSDGSAPGAAAPDET
jgi:hypothetical protein